MTVPIFDSPLATDVVFDSAFASEAVFDSAFATEAVLGEPFAIEAVLGGSVVGYAVRRGPCVRYAVWLGLGPSVGGQSVGLRRNAIGAVFVSTSVVMKTITLLGRPIVGDPRVVRTPAEHAPQSHSTPPG